MTKVLTILMTICGICSADSFDLRTPDWHTVSTDQAAQVVSEQIRKEIAEAASEVSAKDQFAIGAEGKDGSSRFGFTGERAEDGKNGSDVVVFLQGTESGNITVVAYKKTDPTKSFAHIVLTPNGKLIVNTYGGRGGTADSDIYARPEKIPAGTDGGSAGNVKIYALDGQAKDFLSRGYFLNNSRLFPKLSIEAPKTSPAATQNPPPVAT